MQGDYRPFGGGSEEGLTGWKIARGAATRKEAAWRRFYKPSTAHVAASASVECAIEHIRATRALEAKYAAGEL